MNPCILVVSSCVNPVDLHCFFFPFSTFKTLRLVSLGGDYQGLSPARKRKIHQKKSSYHTKLRHQYLMKTHLLVFKVRDCIVCCRKQVLTTSLPQVYKNYFVFVFLDTKDLHATSHLCSWQIQQFVCDLMIIVKVAL